MSTTSTTTSTTAPEVAVVARTTRSFVLRPFSALSAKLSATQRRQINEFASSLVAGDEVVCVGGAGSGPVKLLRDLARMRAMVVCDALSRRAPGVRTSVDIVVSGEVQVTDVATQQGVATQPETAGPVRVSASDLSRRVLVVVRRVRAG